MIASKRYTFLKEMFSVLSIPKEENQNGGQMYKNVQEYQHQKIQIQHLFLKKKHGV